MHFASFGLKGTWAHKEWCSVIIIYIYYIPDDFIAVILCRYTKSSNKSIFTAGCSGCSLLQKTKDERKRKKKCNLGALKPSLSVAAL